MRSPPRENRQRKKAQFVLTFDVAHFTTHPKKNLVTLFVAKQARTSVDKLAASLFNSLTRSAAMCPSSRVSFDLPRFYLGRSKETLLAG